MLVDVDDVLVGRVGLGERVKLVHLLDVPGNKYDKAFSTCSQRVEKSIIRLTITQVGYEGKRSAGPQHKFEVMLEFDTISRIPL